MGKYSIVKEVPDIFKKRITKFPTRGTISMYPNEIWSVDLADLVNQPSNGFKYMFNSIDVFSRKLHSVNMKGKTTEDLKKAIEDCIKFYGSKPKKIWSDRESGLLSNDMKDWLEKKRIIVYHTFGKGGSALAENINRQIKRSIAEAGGTKNWSRYNKTFETKFNETVHSKIGVAPNDAHEEVDGVVNGTALAHNLQNVNQTRKETSRTFKVGDIVRLSRIKKTFEKESSAEGNWTKEKFEVYLVKDTNPTTYCVKDLKGDIISGSFYPQELLKA